ncbi:helix-turn-helix domain-containing protein [Dolosigranulum pigrum]|uniref:helix-turn-helix domain-containing protein n=1 Tax=Dolosigranulum pigrum TaxID=29394 RepID=UPI001AD8651D|nr:helix-turn-helix transcriptional regulator [Dolosigranulum pigrum]QTJ49195.1 helix-turn-helix domain-containing protein [Dolosigranulum pigrum]
MNSSEILRDNLEYIAGHINMNRIGLARITGISYNQILRIFKGENTSLSTVDIIAETLGYETWQLLKEEGAREYWR